MALVFGPIDGRLKFVRCHVGISDTQSRLQPIDPRGKLLQFMRKLRRFLGEAIPPALVISRQRLYQLHSLGSLGWLSHVERGLVTLVGSAEHWRKQINPLIHEQAAYERGLAGVPQRSVDEWQVRVRRERAGTGSSEGISA